MGLKHLIRPVVIGYGKVISPSPFLSEEGCCQVIQSPPAYKGKNADPVKARQQRRWLQILHLCVTSWWFRGRPCRSLNYFGGLLVPSVYIHLHATFQYQILF